MRRTRLRPLPDGRLAPDRSARLRRHPLGRSACWCWPRASTCSAAVVALATLVSYAAIYTPLKRRTSFATVIGAIPGALPPVIGWAAAAEHAVAGRLGAVRHRLPVAAAALPRHRLDVPRGLRPRRLPDAAGDRARRPQHRRARPWSTPRRCCRSPSRRRWSACRAPSYFAGALVLTLLFLGVSLRFAMTRAVRDARRLFFASIIYLPLLWVLMIADRT